jgi:hypothetical protein
LDDTQSSAIALGSLLLVGTTLRVYVGRVAVLREKEERGAARFTRMRHA